MSNKAFPTLKFTGERLIPELNKGAAFFYEHINRYLFAAQFAKNKRVLDIGCGVGYGSNIIINEGNAAKVESIDLSEETINYAKLKYGDANIAFRVDDVTKLQTVKDSSIELAVSFEVIEHISDQKEMLRQVKRVLSKEGVFVVSTPNKYTYPDGNEYHVKELYPEEFYALLSKYFKHFAIYHQTLEFSQVIRKRQESNFRLEETFSRGNTRSYFPQIDEKNSQYILVICSDSDLPECDFLSVASSKIDQFDMRQGYLSLDNQWKDNANQLSVLKDKYTQLMSVHHEDKRILNLILGSKFFKVWQKYCHIRDNLNIFKEKIAGINKK